MREIAAHSLPAEQCSYSPVGGQARTRDVHQLLVHPANDAVQEFLAPQSGELTGGGRAETV